jgi:hypothetical protein
MKWSGKHDSHVLISWSQARRLGFFGFSPINWRMAEGILPKPLTRRFYLFSRQGTATQCFTIHKSGSPGWNRTSGLRFRKPMFCLLNYGRNEMVEDYGSSPYSTGCRPVVSYSVTDPPKNWYPRQDFHPDLRR